MPVSNVPEVGKFLVKAAPSTAAHRWFLPGGRIVRISGQRIYYMEGPIERFTHDAAAVCDTEEEAKQLVAFSEKEEKAHAEYMAALGSRMAAFRETLGATKGTGKATALPKAQGKAQAPQEVKGRVRRVR